MSMFSLELWTETQRTLLTDPAYLGVMPRRTPGSVRVTWAVDARRTDDADRALERLAREGLSIEQTAVHGRFEARYGRADRARPKSAGGDR